MTLILSTPYVVIYLASIFICALLIYDMVKGTDVITLGDLILYTVSTLCPLVNTFLIVFTILNCSTTLEPISNYVLWRRK